MADAVRVALLARPGVAAERLREALQAAGAALVLDADPSALDPGTLAAAGAESVVVVLDPVVEEALDRLDPVLHDPAIDVLYEEAELAAAREGWDAARWTRHLSAKLLRHGDVLPPGREADDMSSAPAGGVPSPPAPSLFDPVAAEYDAAPDAAPDLSLPDLPPFEPDVAPPSPIHAEDHGDDASDAAADAPPAPPAADAAPSPAAPAHADRGNAIRDFRRDLADIEQRIASLGLVDDGPPAAATPADAPGAADVAPAAEASAPGAVLVFAGIGGPDAVRQFLGALPAAFPRPVLIHQRLDGGRHDRLVQQMARATSLPVELAAPDQRARAGHVYVLPPDVSLSGDAGGLRFVAGDDPLGSLPAAESAVLMFSGSDTALVEAALAHAQAGAMVAGQSPEDCYDPAAADALAARGADTGQPADLARRLAERWAA